MLPISFILELICSGLNDVVMSADMNVVFVVCAQMLVSSSVISVMKKGTQ